MAAEQETGSPTRSSRGSRRRPGVEAPEIEKIPPRSTLSRERVIAHQRARIFDGLATALAYHGYEDTKVTDVVELSGVSRATFYERFEGKEICFAEAYGDGVKRLVVAVEAGIEGERGWANRLSSGLRASLEFLAANPPLSHLLLVESLAAARPARLEHERSLERLADALRGPANAVEGTAPVSEETARMLAGGLASHLSGLILAGEAERLPAQHEALLRYLLAPSLAATLHSADERRAAAL